MRGRKLGTSGRIQREGVPDPFDLRRGTGGPLLAPRSLHDVAFGTVSRVEAVRSQFPVSLPSAPRPAERAPGLSEAPALHQRPAVGLHNRRVHSGRGNCLVRDNNAVYKPQVMT